MPATVRTPAFVMLAPFVGLLLDPSITVQDVAAIPVFNDDRSSVCGPDESMRKIPNPLGKIGGPFAASSTLMVTELLAPLLLNAVTI